MLYRAVTAEKKGGKYSRLDRFDGGAKEATKDAEGYTGDTVCSDCGETISKGTSIPKLPAPAPTGDAALAISAFALLAAAGAVLIARKRKIEE